MFQVVGWKSTARRSRNGTECARPYLVAGVQPSPAAATSAFKSRNRWRMEKPDQLGELFRMQQTIDERVGVKTEGLSDEAKTRQFIGNHPQPTTMSRRRNQFETKTGGMTSSPIGRGKRKSRCSPVPARWRRCVSRDGSLWRGTQQS